MRNAEEIRERLREIEQELLTCEDIIKIWKLKTEHKKLQQLLRRLIK